MRHRHRGTSGIASVPRSPHNTAPRMHVIASSSPEFRDVETATESLPREPATDRLPAEMFKPETR